MIVEEQNSNDTQNTNVELNTDYAQNINGEQNADDEQNPDDELNNDDERNTDLDASTAHDSEHGSDLGKVINIKDMAKSYIMGEVTVHALRGVTMDIRKGQVTVILGPSGCGKTTLLNQIGGIDSPTSGTISVNGEEIQDMDQHALTRFRQENIGFIFQFFNLIPNLTARENIEFVLEYVMDLPPSEVHVKAKELLESVGLGDRGDHYPYQLSGGEQQRVSIARALAKDPMVLLADEPTGELDYQTGKMILELLVSFAQEGRAVLIVTHNKELAKIAHRVIHLRDGSILREVRNDVPMKVSELDW